MSSIDDAGVATRRRLMRGGLAAAALLAAGGLAGCATPPDAAAERKALRERRLGEAGFTPQAEGWVLSLRAQLLFDTGSDVLTQSAHASVQQVARTLQELGLEEVRVEGHTDDRGSAVVNQKLSLRRAEAVAEKLVEQGLPRARLSIAGFGDTRPVVPNASDEARAQNRRVVLIIPSL